MKCDSESCKDYFECKYTQHRFNIKMCEYDKAKVDAAHEKELIQREKMLKEINK